jgi:hypothetical protein
MRWYLSPDFVISLNLLNRIREAVNKRLAAADGGPFVFVGKTMLSGPL